MIFMNCNFLIQKIFRQPLSKMYSSASNITSVHFEEGIKKITLNDFKTRNSLSIAMMQNLVEHITQDENNQELRVIVLAAEGSIFSAGHNLKELTPEVGRSQHEEVFKLASQLMYSIIDSPVPVIAQVDGLAAAAGCQLVAQCDIAICSNISKFSTPGVNFGLFCSTPGIPLARKAHRTTALKMLLTGEAISAAEAKSSGLVTTVCPSEDLEKEVKRTCEAIKLKSRSVVELGKKFYYRQVDMDIKKAYELGGGQMVENLSIADGKEGVRSFVEKRKPRWSH
ncbi:enoyl-CoA hydratase domain-containing protein 3, mitochondrial [Leptinotarsa decemlineata]|uniref:enoyl-CoA hydratase domain-containing protein 3, mitochondrial n=1 Tax=Leptinotarsa decemlineata TaxID=7539 RepID=UPI000C254D2E|nr:enoyl-CoA hydratase domain-containing protein 3, mitochondrial [Leptinotarsa decemlineata]